MSTKNAGLAKKLGYTNIKVMLQGVPAWKKSGRMLYASKDYIQNGNNVVIDLRSPVDAAEGHLPRAVNIPFGQLAVSHDALAIKTSAPVVLYGNGDDPQKAVKIIKGGGFKTISLVEGGFEGWKRAGMPVETGPVATVASWERLLGEDEISVADFLKVAESGSDNQVILDVRTAEEAAEGKFANSILLPLDEIAAKMSELPKDKEILAHCTTGARAEMAAKELNKAGYRCRFVLASVECAESDCSVEE